jgi:hypothetical protein
MAKSIKKTIEGIRAKYDATVKLVYACAPNQVTPFSECLKLAPPDLRTQLEALNSQMIGAECDAVSTGKAWRNERGHIMWYL